MTYEKGKPSNICLVAITRLGDLLQSSPTILGLKRENPNARITVVTEKQFASICEGIPGIDEIYEVDLAMVVRCLQREKDGIVDAYRYVNDTIEELKSRNFDYCLNMSSSGYTAMLLKMLEIKESRGWISDAEGYRIISNPWSMLFAAFVYHSNRDYNSINLVDILRCSAGVTEHPTKLMYNVPEASRSFPDKFLADNNLSSGGPLICLQVGASQEKRQWASVKFGAVLKLLVEGLGARVVLTGSDTELKIINEVLSHYSSPRIAVAAGKTNLGELAALLEKADILVTGDTGPMHLAVAVGTPVIAVFLASALCYETGPYSAGNIVAQPQISCNPCNPNFSCARTDCHDEISPELIFYLTKLRLETAVEQLENVRIPKAVADPNHTAVYVTAFDKDKFLEFRQINDFGPRKGFPGQYYEWARRSYRELWKEELNGINSPDLVQASIELGEQEPSLTALKEIIRLTETGMQHVTSLLGVIRDISSPPQLLGQLSRELEKIDRNLEEIGLSNPVLGALVRIFIMEKENMRGEDPHKLASEMKDLYQRLALRGRKFGKLFDYQATHLGA